jgi:hypothetical protein
MLVPSEVLPEVDSFQLIVVEIISALLRNIAHHTSINNLVDALPIHTKVYEGELMLDD